MKASVHPRPLASGDESYHVKWRENGKQKTLVFRSLQGADRFARNVEKFGPAKARDIIQAEDGRATPTEPTLTEAAQHHIKHLTGVEPGTTKRYERYIENDFTEIGGLPLSTISETTIAAWIQWLEVEKDNSGKTIANKHGFLSGVLDRAKREGKITVNPCERTRLPAKDRKREPVFLSRDEYRALLDATPEHWKPLVTWLAATGMRFSEATALQIGDISPRAGTVRIVRAWKYTGLGTIEGRLGGPKSKKGRRTINIPQSAIDVCDLTRGATSLVFTNPKGDRITYARFYESAWEPAVKASGVRCTPHDLRHTCASWRIAAQVPLPVLQAHLGHESITTTIAVYGSLDRSSYLQAADAIGKMIDPS